MGRTPEEILMQSKHESTGELKAVEASDEIITIFCELHGGIEAAMPMVVHQFKENDVDFAHPTKEGLMRVAHGLVKVTSFLKGETLSGKEKKRFDHLIKRIPG